MTTISKQIVVKAVQAAIERARTKTAKSHHAQGKAFELKVLSTLLKDIRKSGYALTCTPQDTSRLRFGGSPCKPNAPAHDYIVATQGTAVYEFRVSVQFTTLSHSRGAAVAPKFSDLHEIDIGIYKPLSGSSYPSFQKVVFAASCKAGSWSKEFAREALGLRRELGFLRGPTASLTPWFEATVPANPAIALSLFSGDQNCVKYVGSLAALGLYIRYLRPG